MQDEDLNNESFEDLCLGLQLPDDSARLDVQHYKKTKRLHPKLINPCHYSTLADRSHSDRVSYAGRRDLQTATLICRTDSRA